jgi:hypothetical protein
MAPDAGTPPSTAARRKTLDDIRREIEAEFAATEPEPPRTPSRTTPRASDTARPSALEAAVLADVETRARGGGRPRWRGYVMAGAIGCIAGQLMILGYVAVVLYGGDIVRLRRAVGSSARTAALAPGGEAATVAAALRPQAPAAGGAVAADDGAADAVVAVPHAAPEADATSASSVPDAAQVPAVEEAAPPAAPPAEVTAPPAPIAAAAPPAPARVVTPRASPVPTAPRRPLVGPVDWVEAQAQVRAALGEWLALSERGGDADVSNAEVILGADGWTAKTRVATRSGRRLVIREQRWERGPSGWGIVADHVEPPAR